MTAFTVYLTDLMWNLHFQLCFLCIPYITDSDLTYHNDYSFWTRCMLSSPTKTGRRLIFLWYFGKCRTTCMIFNSHSQNFSDLSPYLTLSPSTWRNKTSVYHCVQCSSKSENAPVFLELTVFSRLNGVINFCAPKCVL